ncbi:MAG: ImmA/IrrE family metallo-endopeptidase [Planctomycetota bacterium]|nr:ImmA/IrrE family metallo-endopeptidase [Planctomycetota bacterium]
MERKADALLCETFPTGVSVPVDIDFIAENRLQLEIFPVPGLEANYSVWGSFWKTAEGRYKLIIDQDVMDDRPNLYRFTLGEEIAHYVLHRNHFVRVQNVKEACQVQKELQADLHHMERNAKWFSAAILMPSQVLREEANRTYGKLVSHVGYGDTDAILKKLTALLARQFRVSAQAMSIRLDNHPCNVAEAVRTAMAGHHADLWEYGS